MGRPIAHVLQKIVNKYPAAAARGGIEKEWEPGWRQGPIERLCEINALDRATADGPGPMHPSSASS